MIRTLCTVALIATLALVGCKKKADPEPAPVAAEQAPAAPEVEFAFGPAVFSGERADGKTGTVKVDFDITNNSDSGLIVSTVMASLHGDAGKICAGKTSEGGKASKGNAVEGAVELSCAWSDLPDDEVKVKYTVMYSLGGADMEEKNNTMVNLKK